MTFRAVQIKGRSSGPVEDAHPRALERAAQQFALFAEKGAKLGVPAHLAQVLFTTDLVTITVVADEIFDQTPGPGGGKKVA